jgi:hypothetical protein
MRTQSYNRVCAIASNICCFVMQGDVQRSHTEATSSNVVEADAVFSPESHPSTHVLPPEFHFNASQGASNNVTEQEMPASFMHDTTEAPNPSMEQPIDPLDPDFIAKTIADSSIYEELYNEFGMGDQFPADSEDEAEGGAQDVRMPCLLLSLCLGLSIEL